MSRGLLEVDHDFSKLNFPVDSKPVRDAIEAYQKSNFTAAKDGLRALAACNEDCAEAHFALAITLRNGSARDLQECYGHFERTLELRPNDVEVLYQYSRAFSMSSRETEAETLLKKALLLDPTDGRLYEWLAMSLIEQTRFADALPHLEQAVSLLPDHDKLREERDRVRTALSDSAKPRKFARYPRRTVTFENVSKLIDDYILNEFDSAPRFLHSDTKVFTMGSCFATNIAVALRRYGLSARDISEAEEINNTYANRYLMEWIANGESEQTKAFKQSFGEDYRKRLAYLLQTSDVFIMSLGVAPCFFDRVTGAFVPTHGTRLNTALLIRDFAFRTTTVSENVDNLTRIVQIVKTLNPKITVVLTVSPVPLKATFERESPIIADCVSKSTLRVAAHEFLSGSAAMDTIYWPSFEIVRWLGGHIGPVFGTDDGSPFHPDQALIELIMAKFVATFADVQLQTSLSA